MDPYMKLALAIAAGTALALGFEYFIGKIEE